MRTFSFLALHQEDEYGAADIAEFVGVTRSAIVQALGYLERDGLVTKRSVGKKRLYRIRTDTAYYPELRSIALKTLGGIETISKEIQNDPAIQFAAVFGSFARGDEGAQSDIDVLFVIADKGWEETTTASPPRWPVSANRSRDASPRTSIAPPSSSACVEMSTRQSSRSCRRR